MTCKSMHKHWNEDQNMIFWSRYQRDFSIIRYPQRIRSGSETSVADLLYLPGRTQLTLYVFAMENMSEYDLILGQSPPWRNQIHRLPDLLYGCNSKTHHFRFSLPHKSYTGVAANFQKIIRVGLREGCANLVVQDRSVYTSSDPYCTSAGSVGRRSCTLSDWTTLVLHDFL